MNIDLDALCGLRELFKKLSSGMHLNHLLDNRVWVELDNNRDAYQQLFAALGYELIIDGRGFAYFNTDQASSYTGKLTRRLALLLMLLFEYQADQGLHLFQFQQWRINPPLLETLWQTYQPLLEAEEICSPQTLQDVFDSAARIGFMQSDEGVYQLLPAVHRYLDLFLELAKADRSDSDEYSVEGEDETAEDGP